MVRKATSWAGFAARTAAIDLSWEGKLGWARRILIGRKMQINVTKEQAFVELSLSSSALSAV
jgi:hypothetical protein